MPDATLTALIPLLPLAGFLFLGLFGRKYFKKSSGIYRNDFVIGRNCSGNLYCLQLFF